MQRSIIAVLLLALAVGVGIGLGTLVRPENNQLGGTLQVLETGAPTGVSQVGGSFLVSLIGAREPRDLPDEPIVPFVTSLKTTLGNLAPRWFIVANLSKEYVFSMLAAAMPFYAKYVLGASTDETGYLLGAAFVAAIPGLAIWTALAKRFGAWRAWRWACVTFGLSLVPLLLISSVSAAYLFMVLMGLSLAGHLMLSNLLISDAIDADVVDTRTRRAGMYFGINGFLVTGLTAEQMDEMTPSERRLLASKCAEVNGDFFDAVKALLARLGLFAT